MLKIRKVWIIFVTLTENSSIVTNDTKGTSRIFTRPEIALGTHFHQRDGTETTPVFLSPHYQAIRWHSETRKHLFLYARSDRAGSRKPKNNFNQSNRERWEAKLVDVVKHLPHKVLL